jgi:hypothetical protein
MQRSTRRGGERTKQQQTRLPLKCVAFLSLTFLAASAARSMQPANLAVENVDHCRTRAKSPWTDGICERFYRTAQDSYGVAFRKKRYTRWTSCSAIWMMPTGRWPPALARASQRWITGRRELDQEPVVDRPLHHHGCEPVTVPRNKHPRQSPGGVSVCHSGTGCRLDSGKHLH